jgi:hypothetical protein
MQSRNVTKTGGAWDREDKNVYFLAANVPIHFKVLVMENGITTGGKWDKDERNQYFFATNQSMTKQLLKTGGDWSAEERNQYFLATDRKQTNHISRNHELIYPYLLVAINEINDSMEKTMEDILPIGAKWFIDSGIFNLTNEHMRAHGIAMDKALALSPEEIDGFDALFERYVDILGRWKNRCWGYIELDQGGRENKIRTRAKLERMGFNPIPVYHPLNDGWDYFDYLAERYDRICFGNVVQAPPATRKRLLATIWERKQKYPDLWVHLLGVTPNQFLNAYPVDSGDSSSWLSAVRWSGYTPRAALQSFGKMDRGFQYELGEVSAEGREYFKAVAMSAYGAGMSIRNWQHHLSALQSVGIDVHSEGHFAI